MLREPHWVADLEVVDEVYELRLVVGAEAVSSSDLSVVGDDLEVEVADVEEVVHLELVEEEDEGYCALEGLVFERFLVLQDEHAD